MLIYLVPFQTDATLRANVRAASESSKYITTQPVTYATIFQNLAKDITNNRNNAMFSGSFIPDSLASIAILALNDAKYQYVDSTLAKDEIKRGMTQSNLLAM
jgi:hypothetical protein